MTNSSLKIRRSGLVALVSAAILFTTVLTNPFEGTFFGPFTIGGEILGISLLGLFLGATFIFIYRSKRDFNLWETLLAIVLAIAWVPTLLSVIFYLFALSIGWVEITTHV